MNGPVFGEQNNAILSCTLPQQPWVNLTGYSNLYIDGGETIQSFLREDLIDEMIITKIPILLGDGIPLFGRLTNSIKFKHKKTEIYSNSLVKSRYIRNK